MNPAKRWQNGEVAKKVLLSNGTTDQGAVSMGDKAAETGRWRVDLPQIAGPGRRLTVNAVPLFPAWLHQGWLQGPAFKLQTPARPVRTLDESAFLTVRSCSVELPHEPGYLKSATSLATGPPAVVSG